jgi:hypothetical protein
MQEYFRLADGVSEDEASLVFNNAAWKVIKNAFKHARCISVTTVGAHKTPLSCANMSSKCIK